MEERYQLIEPLGVGGMATVHRARDRLLDRQVAIKRLLPHLAADPDAAERFRREAQAAAGLNHPGIVTVYDTGVDSEGPYIVMELLEGETLASKISREGALGPAETAAIVSGAAGALDHAHANGVVHRDIKPSNLIVDGQGRVRLTDFGIARAMESPTMVTGTGELVGTLAYMAPETIAGEPATAAADIYSLGAVTYQMLAGEPPFEADNVGALIAAIQEQTPPALGPQTPAEMAAGVYRALDKDPGRRPPTAGALATSLVAGTTLPFAPEDTTQPILAAGPVAGPTATTRVYRVQGARRSRSRSGGLLIPFLLLIALGLVLAALALAPGAPEAAPAATTVPATTTTTVPATTTTTVPTTTTTVPTTTTLPPDSPEAISTGIYQLLDAMQPPEFNPKEVGDIRERLDEILQEAEEGDREELRQDLEKAFGEVEKLPESEERDRLFEEFTRLAESYGFTVEEVGDGDRGNGDGDGDGGD